MAAKFPIGTIVLLAGAAGAAYYVHKEGGVELAFKKLFNATQGAEQSAEINMKLRLLGFHGENDGTVMAEVEALNPSSVPMKVQSILGNFIVNGKNVGQVKMFGDQVIRANDQGVLPLSVRTMPAAAAIFRTRGISVVFQGTININDHLRPLTMSYKL